MLCDVGTYTQPIGIEIGVADPSLEVGRKRLPRRNDRPWSRQPEKGTIAKLHLRYEEIVAGRQRIWVDRKIELHFLSGHGTFATGKLVWRRVDSINDRIRGGERT